MLLPDFFQALKLSSRIGCSNFKYMKIFWEEHDWNINFK